MMRKILTYFAIIIATTSSIIPVSACTFNFYANRAANTAIKSFANQTSNIVKSLILGKEKSVDTAQTINDITQDFSNSSINNLSKGKKFNNLGDFINNWGENGKINFDGFNPNNGYFVASGKGTLTKTVQEYRNTNNTLSQLKNASIISVANNQMVYDQLQNNQDIKKTIFNFFNNVKKAKKDDENSNKLITFFKNLIIGTDWNNPDETSFQNNLVNPLESLLDYLVDGQWNSTQTSTPTDLTDLTTFMNSWKAPDNSYYSKWVADSAGKWDIKTDKLLDEVPKVKWTTKWKQIDFNFYRSGCLINWVFYKIGKDYQIKQPGNSKYTDRYLSDIINDNLIRNSYGTPTGIDETKLGNDIKQYTNHILDNPLYLITIAQAMIPIIKWFGLDGDVTKGTKNLTFGNIATDKKKQSYNFADLINNLKTLINNPSQLKVIINTLLGNAADNTPGQALLADIKIKIVDLFIVKRYAPLNGLAQGLHPPLKFDVSYLVTTVMKLIESPNVKGTINTIADVYNNWIKPYNDKGKGIKISLDTLKDFLIGSKGLLSVINEQLVEKSLFPIIKEQDIPFDQAQYNQFYQGLGGQIPNQGQPIPLNFISGSTLDLLQNAMANPDSSLAQISLILIGNSNDKTKGIFDTIIASNKQWIENNYTTLFDADNQKLGKIYNQKMTTTIKNNIINSNLQYNFSFTINNKTYLFLVKCRSHDNMNTYKGTKTFHFTDIDLISKTSN